MHTVETLYGPIEESLFDSFAQIKLLVCDIDGVFSDGRIYMGNDGEELKAFSTLDGYGVKAVMKSGIQVAVITGRKSQIVENRMSALGITHIIQGQEQKQSAIKGLQTSLNVSPAETASIGDDMPDVGMFQESMLPISVANGHPYVKQQARYVTSQKGGFGAVREVCDILLQARGALNAIHGSSV